MYIIFFFILGPGALIGEIEALIHDGNNSVTLKAYTDCEVFLIKRKNIV